ncbi:MAG: polyprenol monophosphomannose synthase [Chloroflexi bacterium]|nr:polyprenol monophosphomannose synthase [Chloroflexota bacterium]
MPPEPKLIVVLPTYNESENIVRIVPALFDMAISYLHILVVDDNSPDGTGQLAEELAGRSEYRGRVNVLHRPNKEGLGPAYIQGFKHALALGADLVIQMDADLSHQPKYIPQLLERVENFDIVIGSRYAEGGSVDEGWGPLRKLLSWWANRVYTPTILRVPVKDATGGFRVYRRDCLIGMNLDKIKANGYVFMVEMIFVAHRLGYKINEIPIHFPDRQHGLSKMSTTVAAEAALRVWQILIRHRRLNREHRRLRPYAPEG